VPEDAKKCQHCSSDLRNWFLKHWIISTILVLIIIGTVFGSGGKKDSAGTTSSTPTAAAETPVDIKVTASQLYAAYRANEIDADNKYKGKILEVSGTVSTIGKDILDSPYVALKTDDIIGVVQCMLENSEKSKAAGLQKGQRIVVQGKNSGLLMNVILRDCIVK